MVKKSYKKRTMKGSGTGARKRIMTSNRTQKMKTNLRKTQNRKRYEKQMRKKGRHPMFEPLPGQAKKPGRKLTKKNENNVGNRFFPKRNTFRQSAMNCVGRACKRGSKIAQHIIKEMGTGMGKQAKFVAGMGKQAKFVAGKLAGKRKY